MKRNNTFMMSAMALGAAYLMRNPEARQKLKDQFRSFAGTSTKKNNVKTPKRPVTS
ncbi:hypothetical protein [Cytobacillus sp. NCCP-133]|uniref:hypothetical protein n=1 Tax=Cytobacillus sp. NCCP-133 TaxID=766848 RepID=UPI0022302B39|nr:hypothetical protein [Cytobacillus sp. NCCP-133]GLB58772.1 hypothetical protein NCCP133_09050 [Cytobacillus sp. NCCP-133]